METKRDSLAATQVSPPSSGSTATTPAAHGPHRGVSLHKNRPGKLYRIVMHSPVVEPFRHVLRPLLRWAWKPHLAVFGGLELVNLKPPSTLALVVSAIFGPLVFVLLLPLILILVPALMVVGMLAVLAANLQAGAEDTTSHSMALHVLD